jgi:hypothetical protein
MLVLYIFGTVYVVCAAILVGILVLGRRQDSGRGEVRGGRDRGASAREPEAFSTAH